ncbi:MULTISPECIES: NADPH-dependent FMN reductase [unclassified Streptomyces]|uniref:NADPH-dependent FMN reductase n=1 Tax=unclassified Streptomyces TaxID=2593676 RepID=UPI002E793731|nr:MULTISPECIES: NAD(P)H-dependent oxidoreductase [unclassified Streptomyces]MEE1766579.1 NAD(P)H-dependent oxidoreductase [Streptomyces sp. SP18BB07]MEE1837199.1 NAD(P)H-dependent oxidoreductase [Streptomyces sp. SP17KL33]
MKAVAVIGNPKAGSRTRDAAERLAAALGLDCEVLEVAELGAGLLAWGDPDVTAAARRVRSADVVIAASPTYKGTYTGLLKLFLDQLPTATGLAGQVALPLMLGAGPGHALAPELTLKPVLVELGATCPAQGLYQLDSTYTTDDSLARWAGQWSRTVLDAAKTRTAR